MTSQYQLLNRILETKDFTVISQNNITEQYFFNYKTEFNFIKDHVERYGVVPDKLTFVASFPDWEFIEVNEPTSYLLDNLLADYKSYFIGNGFNAIKRQIESGNVKDAEQFFLKAAEDLTKQTTVMTCVDITKDTSRYDRYLDRSINKEEYFLSTGLPELDKLIGGINATSEDMVIAARTGIGKTWLLCIIAAALAKQGRTVGFYSGEMPVDEIAGRIDTLLSNVSNRAITRGDLFVRDHYRRYLDSLAKSNYGSIKVITPNDINGEPTVAALKAFVEKEGINALLIDQYSLLEDQSNSRVMHEKVANISKQVKRLQVQKRIPIISVAQMNRQENKDENGKKTGNDTNQIGLSDRIGQDATTVLMLSRNKTEDNLLEVDVTKARAGGDGKKLIYAVDFDKGYFRYQPQAGDDFSQEEADEEINSYMEGNEE